MKKISALPNSNADGVGGFTYGSVKDVSAPASFDGTPFRADWQNDIQSFHQRLLTAAGIVPDGVADTPATSQLYSSFKALTTAPLAADVTVTVGAAGDYLTINAALEAVTRRYAPVYKVVGVTITINLLAGFVMAEQVIVDGLRLGHVKITGVDAETVITRSSLSTSIDGVFGAFMGVNGATLPVIDQLFNMDTTGTASLRSGVYVTNTSSVYVTQNAGVKNAAGYGIVINASSKGVAANGVFSGCGSGALVSRTSSLSAEYIDVSGATANGISCTDLSNVDATAADASGSGGTGFVVGSGGQITAGGATGSLSIAANTPTSSGIIFQ